MKTITGEIEIPIALRETLNGELLPVRVRSGGVKSFILYRKNELNDYLLHNIRCWMVHSNLFPQYVISYTCTHWLLEITEFFLQFKF